ncbi:putative beta-lysine N-acetyltransferase [Maribellus comscasis]|nr:putative beta-lysine N-acetyltransferase [Maribellus comscasis]
MNDITEGKKMQDKIEKLGKSTIHHGKFNNRIYLMKLHPENVPEIISGMEELAEENGYSKIFAKIPPEALPDFISNDFSIEAFVPRFYKNKQDCLFVSKFKDDKRKKVPKNELKNFHELLHNSDSGKSKKLKYKHSLKYKLEKLSPEDIPAITEVFSRVFETYPFPVHDPKYILETMDEGETQYFGLKEGSKLIGVSTAEVDISNKNAEMTDFAVLPEYRGQNLAFRLLTKMEQEMKYNNIKTVYTMARLKAPGMNKTFLKSGYQFTGTLLNNTNISGNIESLNIYYKHL